MGDSADVSQDFKMTILLKVFKGLFACCFGLAKFLLRVADDGVASLLVVADGGQADRQEGNGVPGDINSSRVSQGIKPLCPLLVSNTRCTKSNHFDIVEIFHELYIHVAQAGKPTSKRDASNYKSPGEFNMLS